MPPASKITAIYWQGKREVAERPAMCRHIGGSAILDPSMQPQSANLPVILSLISQWSAAPVKDMADLGTGGLFLSSHMLGCRNLGTAWMSSIFHLKLQHYEATSWRILLKHHRSTGHHFKNLIDYLYIKRKGDSSLKKETFVAFMKGFIVSRCLFTLRKMNLSDIGSIFILEILSSISCLI